MRRSIAVFNTDGVNLRNELTPLSALVESIEHQAGNCALSGLPIGLPLNISHDLCRPQGWAKGDSILMARDCSRHIGQVLHPTNSEERLEISRLIRCFYEDHDWRAIAPFVEDLLARLDDLDRPDIAFMHREAAAAYAPRLAAQAYPEFFNPSSDFVDKDGLVDYGELLSRTTQVQPGVFHEPTRDVLLFAHPFLRRSLSRQNTLNEYALRSFHEAAQGEGVRARLRLDPALLGHPGSARHMVELEYWHGPRFSDDIAAIPPGVSEHKASEDAKYYSGVDRTQIWWKGVEERALAARTQKIRTFEIEELVEDFSPGLGGERFGCRYAHAEFDVDAGVISHYDCAIRAYEGEAYLKRIDQQIDRAGKHADYTKLMRIDGPLSIAEWKRLLTDAYRGNRLIPEYLGADQDEEAAIAGRRDVDTQLEPQTPSLLAQVAFSLAPYGPRRKGIHVEFAQTHRFGDYELLTAEVGEGTVADLYRSWGGGRETCTVEIGGGAVNLATLELNGPDVTDLWRGISVHLANALDFETAKGRLKSVSLAVRWSREDVQTTFSLSGQADLVSALLRRSRDLVDPTQSADAWAEPVRDALVQLSPPLSAPVDWPISAPGLGRLTISRDGEFEARFLVPDHLRAAIRAKVEAPHLSRGHPHGRNLSGNSGDRTPPAGTKRSCG